LFQKSHIHVLKSESVLEETIENSYSSLKNLGIIIFWGSFMLNKLV